MKKTSLLAAAFFGLTGVALGAFAAHGLKEFLLERGYTQVFETAVKFQFYHTFALLATGILLHLDYDRLLGYAASCFIMGIVFFSGSLYAMCFTGLVIFGPITPIGGTILIIGWGLFFTGVLITKKVS